MESVSPETPDAGIRNSGWKLDFSAQTIRFPGRRGATNNLYSLGLQIGEDGVVADSVVGSPAFEAGISPGMKVVGVNSRVYTHDVLEDAIHAAKDASAPITILVISDDYYRTSTVNYHGGDRYPHLVRDESKPDSLDALAKPRADGH
jgi:predicted metalloprotease with PDZ domain